MLLVHGLTDSPYSVRAMAELFFERGYYVLAQMPQITVFQSVIDATVSAAEVVRGLLVRLPARGHELVAFDVNRSEPGATSAPLAGFVRLRSNPFFDVIRSRIAAALDETKGASQ